MRVPATRAILYEFGQLKMGAVLIKWAWPKIFRAHYCYNPTIVLILDPPLMSSIKQSTATGLSADSDKQCHGLDNYYITSLMFHFNSC